MCKKSYQIILAFFLIQVILNSCNTSETKNHKSFTNSIGMEMVYIPSGSFMMGAQQDSLHLQKFTDKSKDVPYWNETPAHKVKISKGFYMANQEVTIQQFQQFKKDYKGTDYFKPYVTGVSWEEAHEFCQWLSEKEGKPYRLPTEAEWEYVARAGVNTLFWSGDKRPENDDNPWGIKNMASEVPEWCYDWFGPYKDTLQKDPVGYDHSWGKVVRGGSII